MYCHLFENKIHQLFINLHTQTTSKYQIHRYLNNNVNICRWYYLCKLLKSALFFAAILRKIRER